MFKEAKKTMVKCQLCGHESTPVYLLQIVQTAEVNEKYGIIRSLPRVTASYGPFCESCKNKFEEKIQKMLGGGEKENVQKNKH